MKCVVIAAALLAPFAAAAQTNVTYNNRTAFEAAAGQLVTETYGVQTGASLTNRGTNYTLNGVNYSNTGTNGMIYTIGPNFTSFPPAAAYGNSAYLEWQGNTPATMTVTFSSPVTAIGFNYMTLNGDGFGINATINGNTYSLATGSTPGFFGVTTDAPITSFVLSSPVASTIDNLSYSDAVPEPASWALMIGGFGVAGGAVRRRRRVVIAA